MATDSADEPPPSTYEADTGSLGPTSEQSSQGESSKRSKEVEACQTEETGLSSETLIAPFNLSIRC
jgi:hypothetical protein